MTDIQQTKTSSLKSALYDWRHVVLQINGVLRWEEDWYPAAIAGAVSAFYLAIWYIDPTLISFVSFCGLLLTIIDYVGPKVLNQVYSNNWTALQERQYDEVCESMVSGLEKAEGFMHIVKEARSRKPVLHFVATLLFFFSLAAIGNRINNFFLAYLFTLGNCMVPGLLEKGILQQYGAQLTLKVAELFKGKEHLKKVE